MTLLDAFIHLAQPGSMLILCFGVFLGIAIGVLPGINTGTLMVLVLPFTFTMPSVDAVILTGEPLAQRIAAVDAAVKPLADALQGQ